MRPSSAVLHQSRIRLHHLAFPATGFFLHRSRLAFVHLDNLVSFAKRDRDGAVDGYFAGYLPDEVILLFFLGGDLVNAGALRPAERCVLPIDEALQRIKTSTERGEGIYATATAEQLSWMYATCAGPIDSRFVDVIDPTKMFPVLIEECYSGVLELISAGRVNYLRFADGQFAGGYLCDRTSDTTMPAYLESLFAPLPDGGLPATLGTVFAPPAGIPPQALPSQLRMYREIAQRLSGAVETELGGEGESRARRALEMVSATHPAAARLWAAHDEAPNQALPAPALTDALVAWTRELLNGVEILSPGSAPALLRQATRDHRHVLHAAGFYQSLPWTVVWD